MASNSNGGPAANSDEPRASSSGSALPETGMDTVQLMQVLDKRELTSYVPGQDEFLKATEDGCVMKKIINSGHGEKLNTNGVIWYHFVAFYGPQKLKYADSRSGKPHKLDLLKKGKVVAGLYFGLQTMRVCELAQFVLEPGYGYGEVGMLPLVPKNVQLFYNVLVMKYDLREDVKPVKHPFVTVRPLAQNHFSEGEDFMGTSHYRFAAKKFRKAIGMLKRCKTSPGDLAAKTELEMKIRARLADAYFKVGRLEWCTSQCSKVLREGKHIPDVLFLLASAQYESDDFMVAYDNLDRAVEAGYTGDVESLKKKIKDRAIDVCELDIDHSLLSEESSSD